MSLQRVINFSGGKTSAYMTIKYYSKGDIVLFCDTGREHPKTYKFINDFESFENIPVVRLGGKNAFDNFLAAKNYKRIPNRMQRFCTEELKVFTAKRYLKSIGVIRYENIIGFRYDEPRRVISHKEKFKKVETKFPLYEDKIIKDHINAFWNDKPYKLEIPSILGNCTLCFMKGKSAITSILTLYPELADPWIKDEQESKKHFGHTYFPDVTIETLRNIAQNNLFKDYDLNEITPAFDCACTS